MVPEVPAVPEGLEEPELGAAAPDTVGVPTSGAAVARAAMPPDTKLVFETYGV